MVDRWIAAIALSLALGACVKPEATLPMALTPEQTKAVQAGILGALKDPGSAEFGPMVAARNPDKPGVTYVCGSVNAKNSFGGYTGMSPFVGVLGETSVGSPATSIATFKVEGIDGTKDGAAIVRMQCGRRGIAL